MMGRARQHLSRRSPDTVAYAGLGGPDNCQHSGRAAARCTSSRAVRMRAKTSSSLPARRPARGDRLALSRAQQRPGLLGVDGQAMLDDLGRVVTATPAEQAPARFVGGQVDVDGGVQAARAGRRARNAVACSAVRGSRRGGSRSRPPRESPARARPGRPSPRPAPVRRTPRRAAPAGRDRYRPRWPGGGWRRSRSGPGRGAGPDGPPACPCRRPAGRGSSDGGSRAAGRTLARRPLNSVIAAGAAMVSTASAATCTATSRRVDRPSGSGAAHGRRRAPWSAACPRRCGPAGSPVSSGAA